MSAIAISPRLPRGNDQTNPFFEATKTGAHKPPKPRYTEREFVGEALMCDCGESTWMRHASGARGCENHHAIVGWSFDIGTRRAVCPRCGEVSR